MARTKPAATRDETSRKLRLSKETLIDLTPKDRKIKGGGTLLRSLTPQCLLTLRNC